MVMKKHEIWVDAEGLPGVCFAGKEGDAFRSMLSQPAKLVHEYMANSHYDAMVYYYNYYGYEPYRTEFPHSDKKPYNEWNCV